MKRILIGLSFLWLASLACTLTSSPEAENDTLSTPTPARISVAQTETAAATPLVTPTRTPLPTPPTRLPTLFPTPRQFATPLPAQNLPPAAPPANPPAANNVGVSVAGDPTANAPQGAGMYFPNTIVFTRGGSIAAVARSGGASTTIVGGGRAQRSPNGLVVSSSQGDVRPDGASVARIGGRTTLTAWGNDGRLAYWGVGNQLYSTSNGGSAPITDIFGDLISVSFSPDGSTLLFASRDQVRRIMGDGAIITTWDSGGDSIVDGPYWALRNGNWGIYVRLASGRRVFMGEGGGDISDPFEHLQLASPASEAGRVYVRTDNGGSLTLVAVWPGAADFEFTAPSLQDVSWSPDGPQLVYASTGGELVLLDVSTGASQVLTGGGVRYPIWSSPRYLVRN